MFARDHADRDFADLNRFVTLLANDAAMRRANHGRDYCRAMAPLFEEVMAVQPEKLAEYAHERTFVSAAIPDSCKSEATIAERR
jgi:hypothetical protein